MWVYAFMDDEILSNGCVVCCCGFLSLKEEKVLLLCRCCEEVRPYQRDKVDGLGLGLMSRKTQQFMLEAY